MISTILKTRKGQTGSQGVEYKPNFDREQNQM